MPARQVVRRLIDHCAPYAEKLDCLQYLKGLEDILENGTGARRQRKVFEQTGDMKRVVEFLVEQSSRASGV